MKIPMLCTNEECTLSKECKISLDNNVLKGTYQFEIHARQDKKGKCKQFIKKGGKNA